MTADASSGWPAPPEGTIPSAGGPAGVAVPPAQPVTPPAQPPVTPPGAVATVPSPQPAPPKKRSTAKIVLIVVVLLALLSCCCIGAFVGWGVYSESQKQARAQTMLKDSVEAATQAGKVLGEVDALVDSDFRALPTSDVAGLRDRSKAAGDKIGELAGSFDAAVRDDLPEDTRLLAEKVGALLAAQSEALDQADVILGRCFKSKAAMTKSIGGWKAIQEELELSGKAIDNANRGKYVGSSEVKAGSSVAKNLASGALARLDAARGAYVAAKRILPEADFTRHMLYIEKRRPLVSLIKRIGLARIAGGSGGSLVDEYNDNRLAAAAILEKIPSPQDIGPVLSYIKGSDAIVSKYKVSSKAAADAADEVARAGQGLDESE